MAALDELLDEPVARHPVQAAELSSEDKKLAAEKAARNVEVLESSLTAKREEFEALPGGRLVVKAKPGQPLWPQGFDPATLTRDGTHLIVTLQ